MRRPWRFTSFPPDFDAQNGALTEWSGCGDWRFGRVTREARSESKRCPDRGRGHQLMLDHGGKARRGRDLAGKNDRGNPCTDVVRTGRGDGCPDAVAPAFLAEQALQA